YRVKCDHLVTKAIADGITAAGLHTYLDKLCLVGATAWDEGFINGLNSSKIVLFTISADCITSFGFTPDKPDNLLLEWELALNRENQGLCVIVPLYVHENNAPFVFPDLSNFADKFHNYPQKSPQKLTFRGVMAALRGRQGINVHVLRATDRVVVDSWSIAQMVGIHSRVEDWNGSLKEFDVGLAKSEQVDLDSSLGHYRKRMANLMKSPITSNYEVIVADVLEWVDDINSRALVIPTDLSNTVQQALIKTNALAACLTVSNDSDAISLIREFAATLSNSYPEFGRVLLSKFKQATASFVRKSFKLTKSITTFTTIAKKTRTVLDVRQKYKYVAVKARNLESAAAKQFEFLILNSLESCSLSQKSLVLLIEVGDTFISKTKSGELMLDQLSLLPESFKIAFLGPAAKNWAFHLKGFLVSDYHLNETAQSKPSIIKTVIKIPMDPIIVYSSYEIANTQNNLENADFLICCGSKNELTIANKLVPLLALNGSHAVVIQDMATANLFVSTDNRKMLALFLFSNLGLSEFEIPGNHFIEHMKQAFQKKNSGVYALPIMVETAVEQFDIERLFSFNYAHSTTIAVIKDMFQLQGQRIDMNDPTRIIARVFQIRKIALNLSVSGNVDLSTLPLNASEEADLFAWLDPPVDAIEQERSRMMNQYVPGTRKWLLSNLENFIINPDCQLLWLNAPAGTGKSVMSALIADRLQKKNQLGSVFFCKSDNQNLKSPLNLVRSMAYHLALWSPPYGRELLSLHRAEAIDFRVGSSMLFQKLISEPLTDVNTKLKFSETLVLLVDAIDECGELNSRSAMLSIFSQSFKQLPPFVKIIVTSRPETDIVAAFEASKLPQQTIIPSAEDNQKDAVVVIRTRLESFGVTSSINDEIVSTLLDKSGGLFIWLVMALESLKPKGTSLTLEDVNALPLGLSAIYQSAFSRAFNRRTDCILTSVICLIAVAKEPLTIKEISYFIEFKEPNVKYCISLLQSLLNIGSNGKISFLHKSVQDYVTSDECIDFRFKIILDDADDWMIVRLLRIICDHYSESQSVIPKTAHHYAVSNWIEHIHDRIFLDSIFDNLLDAFIQTFERIHSRKFTEDIFKALFIKFLEVYGPRALLAAVEKRLAWLVKEILVRGNGKELLMMSDLIQKSVSRSPLLYEAATSGSHEICLYLLKYGKANPACRGITPFQSSGEINKTPLHVAGAINSLKTIKVILENAPNPLELLYLTEDNGFNPMSYTTGKIFRYYKSVERRLEFEAHRDKMNSIFLAAWEGTLEPLVTSEIFFQTNNFDKNRTALHYAAERGNVKLVKTLITDGSSVNAEDEWGWTPIFVAIENGHEDVVLLLIENGASLDQRVFYDDNSRAYYNLGVLHYAAICGEISISSILIQNGADINAHCELDGGFWTPIWCAAKHGYAEIVEFFINKGAKRVIEVDGVMDQSDQFNLNWPAQNGHAKVVSLLVRKGAAVDLIPMNAWWTPLNLAARYGRVEVAKVLIEEGAQVNYEQSSETWFGSPLHFAAEAGQTAVAALLLENGANVNQCSFYGKTPLFSAVKNGRKEVVYLLIAKGGNIHHLDLDQNTLLHIACDIGHREIVALLVENGISLEAVNNTGLTSLHKAAASGRKEVVSFVLRKGANVNFKTADKSTPLHLAVSSKDEETVTVLINNTACVDAINSDGCTPLHIAAENGSTAIASILMKHGANMNVRNNSNESPFLLAIKKRQTNVACLLIEQGSFVDGIDAKSLNKPNENERRTMLHWAAEKGCKYSVELLIEKGASVNVGDKNKSTPLMLATQNKNEEIVAKLLKHGATSQQIDAIPFSICNQENRNMVFDVEGKSEEQNGSRILVYENHGGDNQKFVWDGDMIRNIHSGKVLDVSGCNFENGTEVIQWEENGGENQKWEFKNGLILSKYNNKFAIDWNQSDNSLIIWESHGAWNQCWQTDS
ncbi:hypothetical protein HK100_000175, partial [Physocladia obscura]